MFALDGATLAGVITSLLTGLAAIITAMGGILLATNEGRKRSRAEEARKKEQRRDEADAMNEDWLALYQYSYKLRKLMAEAGIECPPLPEFHADEVRERGLAE